jgi:hypothetical protein
VLECDDITIASNIDRIDGLDGVSVALICAAATHPGGEVLDGGLENEEELHRRTDIERHTQDYTIGMAVYPLCLSKLEEGRAMLVQGVSCYRADREFGYRWQPEASLMNVILAAPRLKPRLYGTNKNYFNVHDRVHMYLTVTAAFQAAATSTCDVLVVSDFGCRSFGHPAQEVASIIYKVAYEFREHFKAIIVAIPPTSLSATDSTNYE